ncbi:o-succinylbenzoate synthase [Rubrobacter xylanophilus]|uniref:o-succinylbenzoate synthase n=1 Tax=Rubrobacter xylanophilus TaxID=49319 RepID=A0A510HLG7_9ACTN|nr:o-succinylbenzoate synthase [Rubrobacter xylanophilus]
MREGLLIRLEEDGACGWGEAAPLPGFSRETLEEAARDLRALAAGGDPAHACSSARFAFELARLNLESSSSGRPLHALLSPHPAEEVRLCGLLEGPLEAVLSGAEGMREAGYAAVKLKVGRADPEEEAALVGELSALLGGVQLRLDANRAWSFGEALRFCRAVRGVPIEYLEEPLFEAGDLPLLAEETGVPLALDETLREIEPEDLARCRHVRAVVLKPTLLGGLSRSLAFAREARRIGAVAVASSSYESGIGTLGLLTLAAALGEVPAGLDTYRALGEDVLEDPLPLAGPRVDVAALLGEEHAVRVDPLEEVAA